MGKYLGYEITGQLLLCFVGYKIYNKVKANVKCLTPGLRRTSKLSTDQKGHPGQSKSVFKIMTS